MVERRPPDSWIVWQARRLLCGISFAVFGIGALALSLVWFNWLLISEKDEVRRMLRARATVSASFRLFLRYLAAVRVADIDASAVRQVAGEKGVILVANHPTLIDYVMIASSIPAMDCLVKAQLNDNPFLRGVVRASRYLFNNSETVLEDASRRLAAGESILIFPEGTRTRPGEDLHLQRGVAQLSLRTGAPVRTIHIQCSERWLDKASAWYDVPRARPVIRLAVGPQLNPAEFVAQGEEGFSLAARRMTRRLTEILRGGLNA